MNLRKVFLLTTAYLLVGLLKASTASSGIVDTTNTITDTPQTVIQLTYINGELVELVDNCTVGVTSSCPYNSCCTKKYMVYTAGFTGSRPVYQLECKPLRQTGEFCYFKTPEQYCPCATRCHTNGFYGSCL